MRLKVYGIRQKMHKRKITEGVVATSNNAMIVCFLIFNTLFPTFLVLVLRQSTINKNGKRDDQEKQNEQKVSGIHTHASENDDERSERFTQGENTQHPKPHH
jgi:hypothetical protein